MVRRKTTEQGAVRRNEELLVFARSYLSDAFPNPERIGCPTDDALRLRAIRPLKGDASIGEHLMSCSPCFNAYMVHLEQARARVRKITWVKRSVAAVGVAAVLAIVCYLFLAKPGGTPLVAPRNPAPIANPQKPGETPATVNYVPLSIDLSGATPTRGSRETATHMAPQPIPSNSPVAMSLRLPLASEEGLYSITLSSEGHVVWSAQSQARRENGDTVLRVHADFKDIPAGRYTLRVSSSGRHLTVPVLIQSAQPRNKEQNH
jgi:hypothetical protein